MRLAEDERLAERHWPLVQCLLLDRFLGRLVRLQRSLALRLEVKQLVERRLNLLVAGSHGPSC